MRISDSEIESIEADESAIPTLLNVTGVYKFISPYFCICCFRSVTLDKCRKLTIVLGPIENTLQLNHCEDCLIVSACRRTVLVACRRCTLHLCIPSRPILIQPPMPSGNNVTSLSSGGTVGVGGGLSAPSQTSNAPGTPTPAAGVTQLGNEEIILAPYHTTYLRLSDHMMRVNLSTKVNYWDKPFLLGNLHFFSTFVSFTCFPSFLPS